MCYSTLKMSKSMVCVKWVCGEYLTASGCGEYLLLRFLFWISIWFLRLIVLNQLFCDVSLSVCWLCESWKMRLRWDLHATRIFILEWVYEYTHLWKCFQNNFLFSPIQSHSGKHIWATVRIKECYSCVTIQPQKSTSTTDPRFYEKSLIIYVSVFFFYMLRFSTQ